MAEMRIVQRRKPEEKRQALQTNKVERPQPISEPWQLPPQPREQEPQERPQKRPHKSRKGAIGILVICLIVAGFFLFNYLSPMLFSNDDAPLPLTLTTDNWTFTSEQVSAGSAYDLSTEVHNSAGHSVVGFADLGVMSSSDGGATWAPYSFAGHIDVIYTQGGAMLYQGAEINASHLRFPPSDSFQFSTGEIPTALAFHITFSENIEVGMYKFSLRIRPVGGWGL
jgi:hypothetical protein